MKGSRTTSLAAAAILVCLVLAGCTPAASPVPTATTAPAPAPTATPTKAAIPTPTVAPTLAPTVAPTPAAFTDPFAYCAAVQNLDAPGARFSGPKAPDVIVKGLATILKIPDTMPLEQQARSMLWRCMGGKVYACTVGANLPCSEKADLSKTPTTGMKEFCTANPASDFIPAAVTGRATVYSWSCSAGAPVAGKQVAEPDARGFLSNYWYAIPPN